jgi:hypothetical protein
MSEQPKTPVQPKVPIILYESDESGKTNLIPFIQINKDEEMPYVLFISEYKETGEFEVETQHGSVPIVDMMIHQFVSMTKLKDRLDPKTFDKVRTALGLMPLKKAQKLGNNILEKATSGANKNLEALMGSTAIAKGEWGKQHQESNTIERLREEEKETKQS